MIIHFSNILDNFIKALYIFSSPRFLKHILTAFIKSTLARGCVNPLISHYNKEPTLRLFACFKLLFKCLFLYSNDFICIILPVLCCFIFINTYTSNFLFSLVLLYFAMHCFLILSYHPSHLVLVQLLFYLGKYSL